MNNNDFTPKNNLDEYLFDPINVKIYLRLKLPGSINDEGIDMLEFFNQQYQALNYITNNKHQPLVALDYIKKLPLNDQYRSTFTYYFLALLKNVVKVNTDLLSCFLIIEDWYNEYLDQLSQWEDAELTPQKDLEQPDWGKYSLEKLSLKEIALLYNYNDDLITSENMDEIARIFGHTSGKKLLQEFNRYRKTNDRIGSTGHKIDSNQAQRIENVIKLLTGAPRTKATDELNTLLAKIEKY